MKKLLLLGTLLCLTIALAACVTPNTPPGQIEAEPGPEVPVEEPLYDFPVRDGLYIFEDARMSLRFGVPVQQYEDHTIYFGRLFLQSGPADTPPLDGIQVLYCPPGLLEEITDMVSENYSEETLDEVEQMLYERSRQLYSILYYSVAAWNDWLYTGKTIADITGNSENTELGQQNGRVYVYTEPPPSEEGLSEEELPVYRQALATLPTMRSHAAMLEKASEKSGNTFPTFSALDIYGNAVDNSIFADHDLTMMNIWGTFCGPCIMEMPDLGEMALAMPAGTQLVGLVGDALNAENIELAQSIAESTGATYLHIVPNKVLYDYLNDNITAYPTTVFIDSHGYMVGEPAIGAMSRDRYEAELNKRLQMLQ